MAVQILTATDYDNNPPQLKLLPKFLTPSRKRYLIIMAIITLVLGTLVGIFSKGSFFNNFMSIVFIMGLLQIAVFYFQLKAFTVKAKLSNGASINTLQPIHDYYKKVFINAGYNIDYEARGMVIDAKNKKNWLYRRS